MLKETTDEFKKFVMRGNVVDMAVGVVLGGAFGKIIMSLVNDVIMPPIGLLLANVDFTSLFVSLNGKVYASLAEAQAAGAPTLNYGVFLNTVINFLIVAFAVFMMVKVMSRIRKKEALAAPVPAVPTKQEVLLEEIRDLLAKR